MSPQPGKSLELFFVDGDPEGLLTAEVFGWTGHIIRLPRLRMKTGLGLPETGHTGVYLLLGYSDDREKLYIGEAESVGKRIRDHDAAKEWWQTATLITTSSDALHKAHVKYLESRLVEEAKNAGAAELENGNIPPRSSLNRAAVANMESFLDTILMILPALGVSVFQSGRKPAPEIKFDEDPAIIFHLSTPRNGVVGKAKLVGSNFVVLTGSTARRSWAGKGDHDVGYQRLHEKLLRTGVMRPTDTHAIFQEDYAFNSPSAAASVLNGRPANGRIEWHLPNSGKTFGEWEQDNISAG
ncbi:GIY-YIG nuclease family protein [Roseivivax sp. CAU 1753]